MYEDVKERTRTFYNDIWNEGRFDRISDFVATDYVLHDPSAPGGELRGIDGLKGYVTTFRTAFPDLKFAIDHIIAEDDHVAVRWTATGTHTGDFMGIPPTQKFGTVKGITYSKYADGKVVESFISKDDLGMFQLLGKVPELFPELARV